MASVKPSPLFLEGRLMLKPKYTLDYKLIKEQVDRLLESVPNKLEREWPSSRTPPTNPVFTVVLGITGIVGNTFKVIRFLCSEKRQDWRHRPEMALVVPILARTILDALYTCVFMFEDLPTRVDWYLRSGWREMSDYIDRATRDYGSDPDWAEYIIQAEAGSEHLARLIGKPPHELGSTEWWPTPQQMKRQTKNPATEAFFGYLDDWFYREFSQVSHGSLPGLIHTAGALRDLSKGKTAKVEVLRGYHSMQVICEQAYVARFTKFWPNLNLSQPSAGIDAGAQYFKFRR
jgi:hypothetical protein